MLSTCLIAFVPILLGISVAAQVPSGGDGIVTGSISSTSAVASASNATCSLSGSVTDFLDCEKTDVSSTTLILAGIGVTFSILIIVGLSVWLCQRSKRRKYEYEQQQRVLRDEPIPQGTKEELYPDSTVHEVRIGQPEKEVDSLYGDHPPPRPPVADQKTRPIQPNQLEIPSDPKAVEGGSPTDVGGGRVLYPSNPSPMPRHLNAVQSGGRPPSSMTQRQSMYPRPRSIVKSYNHDQQRGRPPLPNNDSDDKQHPYASAAPQSGSKIRRAQAASHPQPPAHTVQTGGQGQLHQSTRPKSVSTADRHNVTRHSQAHGSTKPLNLRKPSVNSSHGSAVPPPTDPLPAMPVSIDPPTYTSDVESDPSNILRTQDQPVNPYDQEDGPEILQENTPRRGKRESSPLSVAIPSYYEATRQTVYDPTKIVVDSRAPSMYEAGSVRRPSRQSTLDHLPNPQVQTKRNKPSETGPTHQEPETIFVSSPDEYRRDQLPPRRSSAHPDSRAHPPAKHPAAPREVQAIDPLPKLEVPIPEGSQDRISSHHVSSSPRESKPASQPESDQSSKGCDRTRLSPPSKAGNRNSGASSPASDHRSDTGSSIHTPTFSDEGEGSHPSTGGLGVPSLTDQRRQSGTSLNSEYASDASSTRRPSSVERGGRV